MIKIRTILLLFVLFSLQNLIAQQSLSTDDKKALAYFDEAIKQYKYNEFKNAEFNFKKAIERDSGFVEAHFELGLLYGEEKDYSKAVASLTYVIELNEERFPDAYYYIGLFSINQGKYEESKKSLTTYLATENQDLKKQENANRMLQKCEFALRYENQEVEFNPINLGPQINSVYREYYPCLTADDEVLLYTRQVPSNMTINGTNEEFFISQRDGRGWLHSRNMGPPINTLNNEGAPSLSVDGLLLIFTACPLYGDYGPGREGHGSCDLFFTQKIGDRWTKPKNLGPPVNTKYWETQPSLASDGRTMYFIRGVTANGQKEIDIYQTYLSDTGWTEPVKLPRPVNTSGNEESVFIHPDGKTLYFSSDGHPGFGGLDIFMTQKDEEGNWSKPVNLGKPINTENDENSLMVNATGEDGYFASDRPGGFGSLDLYKFSMPEDKRPDKVTFMKGKVYDARTKRPLLAKFELIDLKSGETIIESYSNGGNGEFLICLPPGKDYALNASKEGYLFYSDNFTLTDNSTTNSPFVKDVPMMPIVEGAKTVLNNIFFETNKYDLKPASKVELNKLLGFMETNPNVKVEIGGHTDNTGSKEINNALSMNRAKAVYDFLINQGIDSSRLSFKGYADLEPVASNDSVKGRARNRRTEFKIVGIRP